jgi:hypothetical protein
MGAAFPGGGTDLTGGTNGFLHGVFVDVGGGFGSVGDLFDGLEVEEDGAIFLAGSGVVGA